MGLYDGDMPVDNTSLMYGSDVEPYYEPTYGGDVGAYGNVDQPVDWNQYADYYGGEPTYGGDVGAYGNVDQPVDWSKYGDLAGYVNPEAELAARGGYTPPSEPANTGFQWDQDKGLLANLAAQATGRFQKNPMEALVGMGSFGASLYAAMQQNKQLEEQAKQIRDAKAKREARLAKYGAVLPMKMDRQLLPSQGDLLTAGQRPGGLNWFTPTTFTNMADGGEVKRGLISRLLGPSPLPDMPIGSRYPMEDVELQKYRLYKMQQEENQEPYIDYERWKSRGMRGMYTGGLAMAHGGGQDDVVDIKAAPGEYVFDADVVSALGDGNNEEGARKLDAMRARIRQHKRSAPTSDIPPRARNIESYMRGK